MTQGAASRTEGAPLSAALEAMPDGVVTFDADWTICYINPAGAALLGRSVEALVERTIWVALPELGGTIFHSFLLHARGVGGRVTWRGFYAPTDRWLTATAVLTGRDLQVYFREAGDHLAESAPPAEALPDEADGDRDTDRDRLRFLAEVSEAMISTLVTGESAGRLAELMVPRLADWAAVVLVGEEGAADEEAWAHGTQARREDLNTYMTERLRVTGEDAALINALLTGEPVQVPIEEDRVAPTLPTERVRAAWRRLETKTCTIVPLRARGETFGVMALMNCGARPPHSEMEIATAVEAARRGALALDNSRLYGRQLKVAETLQHSLLTPPPQPDHLELSVRYEPAASYQQVGGDWYDAFQQPDGATLLVIGDVVGHNVDAAAAMGQIRSILRGIAYDRPDSPARTLTRVDGVLTGLHIGTMATALLARLEQTPEQKLTQQRTLRWSSAGHLPPLLLRPDGSVAVLATTPERLLGAEVTSPRSDHTVVLEPGDTVVFYTDGLVEHARTGIDEGIERLADVLGENPALPLPTLCDRLLEQIVTGRADDDIAVLAVRCHPEF